MPLSALHRKSFQDNPASHSVKMLRQSALLIWEAAVLSSRRRLQLERSIGVATCDLAAACWDSTESPGSKGEATASTSYRVQQGNAEARDTTFDTGGRRWKQTWQKEIAQRSATTGKARSGESAKQEGASAGSVSHVGAMFVIILDAARLHTMAGWW